MEDVRSSSFRILSYSCILHIFLISIHDTSNHVGWCLRDARRGGSCGVLFVSLFFLLHFFPTMLARNDRFLRSLVVHDACFLCVSFVTVFRLDKGHPGCDESFL